MVYQTRATIERADSNLMGPSFAWRTFERGGFGQEVEELRARVPHARECRVTGALATLGQGDHVAGDCTQEGHVAGLVHAGAYSASRALDAREIYPEDEQCLVGLVLDDFFLVEVVPLLDPSEFPIIIIIIIISIIIIYYLFNRSAHSAGPVSSRCDHGTCS